MTTLRRQVGDLVRYNRDRLGMTQAELGDAVGKSLETIGRIERGVTAPSLSLLEKLADALGVDPRDLLGAGSFAAKSRKSDPLTKLLDKLVTLSDAEIERADKLLMVAMGWK
jgi:transcriptional regulator with XRE-family HTH domain